jgi:hypothetical protein
MTALSLRENRRSLTRVSPAIAVQVTSSSGAAPVHSFVAVNSSAAASTASCAGTDRVQTVSSASDLPVVRAKYAIPATIASATPTASHRPDRPAACAAWSSSVVTLR